MNNVRLNDSILSNTHVCFSFGVTLLRSHVMCIFVTHCHRVNCVAVTLTLTCQREVWASVYPAYTSRWQLPR